MVNFDSVLVDIGEIGRWQVMVCLLCWIPPFFGGVHVLMFSFTGLEPSNGFRCKIPDCDGSEFGFNDFGDIFERDSDGEKDYCTYKQYTKTDQGCVFNGTGYQRCSSDEYAYADFQFEETVVTEWDLVCDQQAKIAWVGSVYMFGLMVGSYLCGTMADKYGRKFCLLFSILISSVASLLGAFMPEYFSYTTTRFFTAIGAQGIFLSPFALTVEVVGANPVLPFLPWPVQYKTLAGVMIQAPFAVGMACLSWLAMYIKDWSTLQMVASIITFAQLIFWWFTPESPRWLLAAGKDEKAKVIIEKAAKMNRKQTYHFTNQSNDVELENADKDNDSRKGSVAHDGAQYGVRDLFHPSIRKISLILMVCWPIVTLGYYGITFSLSSLNDDIFISNIIGSLIEIPAYIIVGLFMDTWGRKPLFSLSLLISGICCIVCGTLDEGSLRTSLAMFGKFFASSSFALVYMYTAELLPTTIRSSGVGVCSLMARIGGISAPQIALSLPKTSAGPGSPFYVMGACSVAGGLLALLLPETLGSTLPTTMKDIDEIKANAKPIWKCYTGPKKS